MTTQTAVTKRRTDYVPDRRLIALTATLLTAPAWADEGLTERDFIGDYAPHLDGVLTLSRAPLKREEKG